MIIYFGVTGTLLDGAGNIRRYADFVLRQLTAEGHRLFLLTGDKDDGPEDVLKNAGLLPYFERMMEPGSDDPAPDFIIDANSDSFLPDTAGYQVPFFNQYAMMDDEELLEAFRQIRRIDGKPGPPPRRDVSEWTSRRSKS